MEEDDPGPPTDKKSKDKAPPKSSDDQLEEEDDPKSSTHRSDETEKSKGKQQKAGGQKEPPKKLNEKDSPEIIEEDTKEEGDNQQAPSKKKNKKKKKKKSSATDTSKSMVVELEEEDDESPLSKNSTSIVNDQPRSSKGTAQEVDASKLPTKKRGNLKDPPKNNAANLGEEKTTESSSVDPSPSLAVAGTNTPHPTSSSAGGEEAGGNKDVPGSMDSKMSSSSMSFSDIPAATPSKEKGNEVIQKFKDAFSTDVEALEEVAKEVLANVENLPYAGLHFFLSIFGWGDIKPVKNMVEDLEKFTPLCTSLKFASLARHKMSNDGVYQFRLRYFGGLGGEDEESKKHPDRNDPNLKVADFIKQFFTSIFQHPEYENIEKCTRKARTLFITARTLFPTTGARGGDLNRALAGENEGSAPDSGHEECIIAAINFALLGANGFFVNWLATTNEKIDLQNKYGNSLKVVCSEGSTFQHRHLALFLMKAAQFAVVTHLRLEKALSPENCIVLQARVASKEASAKFYGRIGFEEVGAIDDDPTLRSEIFESFPTLLTDAQKSKTDFIHFIRNQEDICLFKNDTGSFGRIHSLSRRFGKISCGTNDNYISESDDFSFPFAIQRRNLMLLSSNLYFFFLPFRDNAHLDDFIEPNRAITIITARERKLLGKQSGWLNDECIDFYIRW